jgi:GH15 family glucan-1,4-alpha-glucosidase
MTSIRNSIATVALVTVGLVTSGTTAAFAHDDDRVIVTGDCSGSADWKVKVKTDDGRLEVEGEVDSNVAGQRWRWTLRHNGSVSDRGVATTTARSGSFEVERTIVDLAGTDRVVFRAVRDGQTCRGVVNY